MVLILTCEHAHNKLPGKFKSLFPESQVHSHEGWDIGALALSKKISNALKTSFFYGKVSRLIVDLNRSMTAPDLFSKPIKRLKSDVKETLLQKYYYPYREDVVDLIDLLVLEKVQVFHIGVHTFTPKLEGKKRDCDIGLLFDPDRVVEKNFCKELKEILLELDPTLKIRFNYPYKGVSDGFTTTLRKRYKQSRYIGIELEVNQKFPLGEDKRWENLQKNIVSALKMLFL